VKVLFDHNLPHKLRTALLTLCQHQIVTTAYMGWSDLKNGELLRTAEEGGIEVFVTGDRSLVYEQNLTGRRLAIVALSANNWPIVKNHISQILAVMDNSLPGSFQTVACGTFSRKKIPDE
jgi:predicted nuclease of predicted toxin-antitoxin system